MIVIDSISILHIHILMAVNAFWQRLDIQGIIVPIDLRSTKHASQEMIATRRKLRELVAAPAAGALSCPRTRARAWGRVAPWTGRASGSGPDCRRRCCQEQVSSYPCPRELFIHGHPGDLDCQRRFISAQCQRDNSAHTYKYLCSSINADA